MSEDSAPRDVALALAPNSVANALVSSLFLFQNIPIWAPRIKKLLTEWQQHQESQRVLKDCRQLLGGVLIAAKAPGSLFPKQRVERLSE